LVIVFFVVRCFLTDLSQAAFRTSWNSSINFWMSVSSLALLLSVPSRSTDPPYVFVVLSLSSCNLSRFPWNLSMSFPFTIYLTPCLSCLLLPHEPCPIGNLRILWSEQLSWSLTSQCSTALISWLQMTVKSTLLQPRLLRKVVRVLSSFLHADVYWFLEDYFSCIGLGVMPRRRPRVAV
jgi:hypothetical protein